MEKSKIRFDLITAHPQAFSYLDTSLIKRAREKNLIQVKTWDLRDFAQGTLKNKSASVPSFAKATVGKRVKSALSPRLQIDDRPYGGGPGMVLKVEPIYKAIQKIKNQKSKSKIKVILTDAAGKQFDQNLAKKLAKEKQLIIICGHYEGVDKRVKKLADLSISVGPYILSGGELPAMVMVDAISRHLPGFLHNPASLEEQRSQLPFRNRPSRNSSPEPEQSSVRDPEANFVLLRDGCSGSLHSAVSPPLSGGPSRNRLREVPSRQLFALPVSIPVYTRPEIFITKDGKKLKVPKVLLSGDHKKIQEWRIKHAQEIKI